MHIFSGATGAYRPVDSETLSTGRYAQGAVLGDGVWGLSPPDSILGKDGGRGGKERGK